MKRRNMILDLLPGVFQLAALALYLSGLSPITLTGLVLNTFRAANSPSGTLVAELRDAQTETAVGTTGAADASSGANAEPSDAGSWTSYNRTLTSQRYSPLRHRRPCRSRSSPGTRLQSRAPANQLLPFSLPAAVVCLAHGRQEDDRLIPCRNDARDAAAGTDGPHTCHARTIPVWQPA